MLAASRHPRVGSGDDSGAPSGGAVLAPPGALRRIATVTARP